MSESEGKNNTDLVVSRTTHKNAKYWAWAMGGPLFTILVNMWGRLQYYAAHILLFSQITISIIYFIYSTVDAFNEPLYSWSLEMTLFFVSKIRTHNSS